MWPNPQETFTEEILNGKLFVCVQWSLHSMNHCHWVIENSNAVFFIHDFTESCPCLAVNHFLQNSIRDVWQALREVSVFGVILVRIFPQSGIWSYSGLYFPAIQSECGKIQTRITPNMGTFYVVMVLNTHDSSTKSQAIS